MKILQLNIDGLTYAAEPGVYRAIVLVRTEDSSLSLSSTAPFAPDAPEEQIRTALIRDALRQIRRMPEYRSGQKSIEICETANVDIPRCA